MIEATAIISERFLFGSCREVAASPHFKKLVTWFREELPQFTWENFTKIMPEAWFAAIIVGDKFVARIRVNVGIPKKIKINTAMPFNGEKAIYISQLYVESQFRKKGFAEKILTRVLEKIRSFKITKTVEVWTEIERDNTFLLYSFKQLGWVETPSAIGGEKLKWLALMRTLGAK
jgi:GNAT superfamily N-acetyltransferase